MELCYVSTYFGEAEKTVPQEYAWFKVLMPKIPKNSIINKPVNQKSGTFREVPYRL